MTDTQGFLLIGAIVSLSAAVSIFMRVFLVVQRKFPMLFKQGLAASPLVDTCVWNEPIPPGTRRLYLLHLGLFALAGLQLAIFFFIGRQPVPGILFSCPTVLAIVHGSRRWMRYRRALR